jgi:sirohydrochlorin cobaltochelatase
MKQALLLFAHGARDPRWAAPFQEVARRIAAQLPEVEVALAYLELMTPSLADAARGLAQAGCDDVAIVPMFLGTGGHVRNDLPRLVDELSRLHPQVRWRLQPPIGEIDSVMQAMADAALRLAME